MLINGLMDLQRHLRDNGHRRVVTNDTKDKQVLDGVMIFETENMVFVYKGLSSFLAVVGQFAKQESKHVLQEEMNCLKSSTPGDQWRNGKYHSFTHSVVRRKKRLICTRLHLIVPEKQVFCRFRCIVNNVEYR